MRCKPVFIVSAVQLFFNFMLKFFSRNEKPPHGPRVVACLLRFPHLMHLDFPTESLHCSVLWLLLSPFLLHKLSESFSFGTVHFCLFIPQPAHENAPHTRYKLECPSLLVSWLRIWPQPFALRPQLIKFIPFHIPFRNKLLILRHGLLFVSCAVRFHMLHVQVQNFLCALCQPLSIRCSQVRILLFWSTTSFFSPVHPINNAHIVSMDDGKTNPPCWCHCGSP